MNLTLKAPKDLFIYDHGNEATWELRGFFLKKMKIIKKEPVYLDGSDWSLLVTQTLKEKN